MKSNVCMASLTLLLSMLNAGVAQADQGAFMPGSLEQIESGYAGEPFILVLWEINCPPCHEEMHLLGKMKADNPDMNLVMIGTDPLAMQAEVTTLQQKYGLGDVESWLFADDNIERLRYIIDPEWFGELPRNYFYDETGNRAGFSGKLNEGMIQQWLLPE